MSDEQELAGVMRRNIRTLLDARAEVVRRRSREERVADAVTGFAGRMIFVYLHAAFFGGWIVWNLGVIPGLRPFDPFPFVMLAMIASVEAIFLSTFVLITQNRMMAQADRRADLDVQVNLLAEHEITQLIELCDAIARRLGVPPHERQGLDELKKDVRPEVVLSEIEQAARDHQEKKAD
jgi:uncharacterized membrane protein